jgi:hypothetical protein
MKLEDEEIAGKTANFIESSTRTRDFSKLKTEIRGKKGSCHQQGSS